MGTAHPEDLGNAHLRRSKRMDRSTFATRAGPTVVDYYTWRRCRDLAGIGGTFTMLKFLQNKRRYAMQEVCMDAVSWA